MNPWLDDPAKNATGGRYEIRTVEDFFKVPADRRRICLREFDSWMAMLEEIPIMLAGDDPELLKAIHTKTDVFVWHDDGRGAVVSTINIEVPPAGGEAQPASSTPTEEQPGKAKGSNTLRVRKG